MSGDLYITLLTSLPYHGELFGEQQTPISRIQLESRLRLLEPEDAVTLDAIEQLIRWANHSLDEDDAAVAAQTQRLLEGEICSWLQQLIAYRMEIRTLMAALRRRRRGEGPPERPSGWGVGRWQRRIHANWSEPGFRLEGVFPWVLEANRLMQEEDHLGLERLLLGVTWRALERFGEGHYFDFEAVVVYVLRWGIIDRWSRYHGKAAVARFESLVEQALAGQRLEFVGDG
ncbi:DUF2764 family protein [endosymbiont of Ridgeia piscesae]|jgi:hypothetical protein|uniref:Uncharacterized protein n=1 Tax=endosymbiont of Ridgeia piscesae TaxID=54398 RepID=A0A0T5YVZ1_9GAMM|nr:DUF2764 family protein [endosymbiont of Ridgeia piscesae]KRT54816.1 Protein of unknown function (DUF2764) [endosymbiont of Ridgeia piscesae]KRT58283.1 Protein of unknown function (DUF2764) [endosymbiont of Ridgeia piscesae]